MNVHYAIAVKGEFNLQLWIPTANSANPLASAPRSRATEARAVATFRHSCTASPTLPDFRFRVIVVVTAASIT